MWKNFLNDDTDHSKPRLAFILRKKIDGFSCQPGNGDHVYLDNSISQCS